MKTTNKRPISSIIMSVISIVVVSIFGFITLMQVVGFSMGLLSVLGGTGDWDLSSWLNLFNAIFSFFSNLSLLLAMVLVIVIIRSATNVVNLFKANNVRFLAWTGYLFMIAFLFDLFASTMTFMMNALGNSNYLEVTVNFALFIVGVLALTISQVLAQGIEYKKETDTLV